MLPDYADIRAMETAPPVWWDQHGVPRYAPFEPRMLGVYDHYALLVLISCQGCRVRFVVGDGWPNTSLFPEPRLTDWDTIEPKSFHYGDPPRHGGCVGETMNCDDIEILEAWERQSGLDWIRVPRHEGHLG